MYPWTPVGVLLATWALLRATKKATWTRRVGAGFATAIALYLWRSTSTFCSPDRAPGGILLAAGTALVLFAPWLLYAFQPGPLAQSLRNTAEFLGLVFTYGRGWSAQ